MDSQIASAALGAPSKRLQRYSAILWPSFLAALVISAIGFFVSDPESVHDCAAILGWPATPDALLLAYSILFFALWLFGALCGCATQYFSK